MCKTTTSNVLALRSKVQGLRREMDLVSQEILALENGKDAELTAATQKALEHGQVRSWGIWDAFKVDSSIKGKLHSMAIIVGGSSGS